MFDFIPRNIDKRKEEIKQQELEKIKKVQNTKIWIGDLELTNNEYLTNLGDLEIVEGNLDLYKCPNLTSLGNLKEVKGDLFLENCTNLTSLGNLKVIEGNLALSNSDINHISEDIIIGGSISKLVQHGKAWNGPNKIKEFNEWHKQKG